MTKIILRGKFISVHFYIRKIITILIFININSWAVPSFYFLIEFPTTQSQGNRPF